MAQKQVKDKSTNKKRRNIALAVCIPVAAAGVAAAITLPLIQCHYQHKEVIPYEALNIAEGEQSRLPDYPTCNILYGFKPEWLKKNKLKGYKVLEIPEDVDYIAPNAFVTQTEESNELVSTIPDNVKTIRFVERQSEREFDQNKLVIDEGAFRFAPVTTLKLPNHLAGTFSGPDLEDYANGPFANMVNLDMIDLSTVTYEAATKLAVKLSWGCFNGTGKDPVEGQQQCAILFNPDLSPQQVEGISATFFNCGLDKDKWFEGVMPRGTTVYMDDEGIVQGFMPNCSTELIEAELLGYQEYDHKCLRMPKGAKGIADHAFENWAGFEEIGKIVQGIIFEDEEVGSTKSQITTIGEHAFKGCTFASNFTIALPSSVTSIGNEAFANIDELSEVQFKGNNITSIGNGAFTECTGLTKLPNFADLVKINEIPEECFAGCTGLKQVLLPANIKKIGKKAFASCKNIESVVFNSTDSLTIGESAFIDNKINAIDLSSLQSAGNLVIGQDAFKLNASQGSISGRVTQWEEWAQWYWNSEVSEQLAIGGIGVDGTNWQFNRSIDDLNRALFYCDTTAGDNTVKIKGFNYSSNPQTGLSDASIKKLIAEIKQNQTASSADITFPATIKCSGVDCRVTEIGGFGNADQEPYFPESVKRISFANINGLSIGKGAFARVTGLTNIAFNNNDTGHTTIGQNAFAGCTGLERLNLPEGVQFAQGVDGGWAFYGCNNISILDLSWMNHDWVVTNKNTYKFGEHTFGAWKSVGTVIFADDLESEDSSWILQSLRDADLPDGWTGYVDIKLVSEKDQYTTFDQKTVSYRFELGEPLTTTTIIKELRATGMTSSSDADGDIKVDLSGEIATDRMSFTITAEISKVNKEGQPMPLKHDDYATFNIFMVGHDETDLEVVFDDFTIRYQDTVNPVNSELKTDLYETTKTFDFYVYDTSVKAPDDLTINISKPKEGSTPGVTIQPGEASVESHSDEGYMILHLPVTIGREQQTLTGGNFAIFDATIGLAGGATAWSPKTIQDLKLTYSANNIYCDDESVNHVTENGNDYSRFHFKIDGVAEAGKEYAFKFNNLKFKRASADGMSLTYGANVGSMESVTVDTWYSFGTSGANAYIGLATTNGEIIAGDEVSFDVVYGYRTIGSKTATTISSENFKVTVRNNMVLSTSTSLDTQPDGRVQNFGIKFTKPWVDGMKLRVSLQKTSGALDTSLENSGTVLEETYTPAAGAMEYSIPVFITSANPSNGQTSVFNLKFEGLEGSSTSAYWTTQIDNFILTYTGPKLSVTEVTKLVCAGNQSDYAIFEFDQTNASEVFANQLNIEIASGSSGNLKAELDSDKLIINATTRKGYVKVNISGGSTIAVGDNVQFDLIITDVVAGWTQTVKGLTVTATNTPVEAVATEQFTEYCGLSVNYAFKLNRKLESSEGEYVQFDIQNVSPSGVTGMTSGAVTPNEDGTGFSAALTMSSSSKAQDVPAGVGATFDAIIVVKNSQDTTIWSKTITGLKATCKGPSFTSWDVGQRMRNSGNYNLNFGVAEDFKYTGGSYWIVTYEREETSTAQITINSANVTAIANNILTLTVSVTSQTASTSSHYKFTFKYFANGDASAGGTPTWAFTTEWIHFWRI